MSDTDPVTMRRLEEANGTSPGQSESVLGTRFFCFLFFLAQVSAGDSHTAALLNDGRVFVWGTFRDSHGPMGLDAAGVARKEPVAFLENEVPPSF